MEVDLHPDTFSGYDEDGIWHDGRYLSYWEKMAGVHDLTMQSLQKAQDENLQYVLFVDGYSTSGPFKITTRSVVRGIMRGKESTPYIVKKNCIQHDTVFVAAIRPKK